MSDNDTIAIELGDNGGQLYFESVSDLHRWVAKERDHWTWLGAGQMPPLRSQLSSHMNGRFSKCQQVASQPTHYVALVQEMYVSRELIASGTQAFQLIERIRETKGAETAAGALAVLLRNFDQSAGLTTSDHWLGGFLAGGFLIGDYKELPEVVKPAD